MNPVTMNNGRYISTRWVLSVVIVLLVGTLSGWGAWMQATVTGDHDKLIQATEKIEHIDVHVSETLDVVKEISDQMSNILADHKEFKKLLDIQSD